MGISDWPEGERPREKLLSLGPAVLSDAELLAIFLRTGVKGKSAVDVARDLLSSFKNLRPLLESDQKSFCKHAGLGPAKYAQLQAVLEMARRHLSQTLSTTDAFTSSDTVKHFLSAKMRHLPHEIFACLFLDNQHRLIKYEELFRGTIDGASVYPREVVKKTLDHNAAAVILAHNHPSGTSEPSRSDKAITRRLVDALDLVDIRVLDHIVIGDGETTSFVEAGMMPTV